MARVGLSAGWEDGRRESRHPIRGNGSVMHVSDTAAVPDGEYRSRHADERAVAQTEMS